MHNFNFIRFKYVSVIKNVCFFFVSRYFLSG